MMESDVVCPFIYSAFMVVYKGIIPRKEADCLKEKCSLYCNICKRCGLVCYCIGKTKEEKNGEIEE